MAQRKLTGGLVQNVVERIHDKMLSGERVEHGSGAGFDQNADLAAALCRQVGVPAAAVRHPRKQTGVSQPVEQGRDGKRLCVLGFEGVNALHDLLYGKRPVGIGEIRAAVIGNGRRQPVLRLAPAGRGGFGAGRRLDGGGGAEHGGELGRQAARPALRRSRRRAFRRGRLRFFGVRCAVRHDLVEHLRNKGKAARHAAVPDEVAGCDRRSVERIDAVRQFFHIHLCAAYHIEFGHAVPP